MHPHSLLRPAACSPKPCILCGHHLTSVFSTAEFIALPILCRKCAPARRRIHDGFPQRFLPRSNSLSLRWIHSRCAPFCCNCAAASLFFSLRQAPTYLPSYLCHAPKP